MKRLVFKGRCDLLARCAIRFVCLAMCLMYRTFGALAQHNTTCCKQTTGFPYMFYSSSPRHFQHTRTSLSGCSEAQQSDFPCHIRLNMCINTHVSRASELLGLGRVRRELFPHFKWCDRPPTRRVSIAPGTVAVRCETRAPVTCPGATFKGPDLHNIQGSVSGRPAASSRTQPGAAISTSYELTQGCGALRTDVL